MERDELLLVEYETQTGSGQIVRRRDLRAGVGFGRGRCDGEFQSVVTRSRDKWLGGVCR
jgi:hypothetical protein